MKTFLVRQVRNRKNQSSFKYLGWMLADECPKDAVIGSPAFTADNLANSISRGGVVGFVVNPSSGYIRRNTNIENIMIARVY
jgi:hypothetical protein